VKHPEWVDGFTILAGQVFFSIIVLASLAAVALISVDAVLAARFYATHPS